MVRQNAAVKYTAHFSRPGTFSSVPNTSEATAKVMPPDSRTGPKGSSSRSRPASTTESPMG